MESLHAIVFLGVVLLVFLVCREIVCWYWKMNETVELLRSIDGHLEMLVGLAAGSTRPPAPRSGKPAGIGPVTFPGDNNQPPRRKKGPGYAFCPHCKAAVDAEARSCSVCKMPI